MEVEMGLPELSISSMALEVLKEAVRPDMSAVTMAEERLCTRLVAPEMVICWGFMRETLYQ